MLVTPKSLTDTVDVLILLTTSRGWSLAAEVGQDSQSVADKDGGWGPRGWGQSEVTPICRGLPVLSLAHFSSSCCFPGGVACCSDDFWCWRRSSAARGGRSSGENGTSWPGERTRRKKKSVWYLKGFPLEFNTVCYRLIIVEK